MRVHRQGRCPGAVHRQGKSPGAVLADAPSGKVPGSCTCRCTVREGARAAAASENGKVPRQGRHTGCGSTGEGLQTGSVVTRTARQTLDTNLARVSPRRTKGGATMLLEHLRRRLPRGSEPGARAREPPKTPRCP